MIPLIYHRAYNITACGLEGLHPFDSRKYGRIYDWLIRQRLRRPSDFTAPSGPCAYGELAEIHTEQYLQSLKRRDVLARILEVPLLRYLPACVVRWRVLRAMRWATSGTVLACQLAINKGLAINLGGGYHHATRDRGGGFCIFADIPLALQRMHDKMLVGSALVVDTDAHQGDGTADAVRPWPWAHMLDVFEEDAFPWPKVEVEIAVALPSSLGGTEYLARLADHLPDALERIRPSLVIYNAGSDVLRTDPLTGLALSAEEMSERDLYVVTQVRDRGIPVAMVLSGGYGPASWEAHAHSIEGILTRYDKVI